LVPLLFLLYINDIADNTQSFSRLFADDTSICHKTLNKLFHDFPKPNKYYGKFLLIGALWNVYA
jgi:hypothetical protein